MPGHPSHSAHPGPGASGGTAAPHPTHAPKGKRGGPFGHVGPPLSEEARRVPVSTQSSRRAVVGSAFLSLLTLAAAGMVCVALGQAVSQLASSTDPRIPWLSLVSWSFVAAASEWVRISVEQHSAGRLSTELQRRLLTKSFALGPARLARMRSGDLQTLATQGVEKIAAYRQTYLGQMIGGMAAPLVALALMAVYVDGVAAAVMLILVPVLPLLLGLFSMVTRKVSGGARKDRTELAVRYLDAIQGLETLTTTGTADRMAGKLAEAGEKNRRATMKVLAANQLILFVMDAGFNLAFITTGVGVAIWRALGGAIDAGGAATIVALTILMLEPMAQIGGFFYVGMGGRANQSAYRAFLGRPAPEAAAGVVRRPVADPAPTGSAVPAGSPLPSSTASAPEVVIEELSFRYPEASQPALTGFSCRIAPGEHVALVGRSGAGKSTLINVLKGMLRADTGTVRVGDITVAASDADGISALRDCSALVSQSTWLFTGTVRTNVAFARPDATEEELWEALAAARLDDEIRALPQGLDTPVGEGGAGLSGGQAQRLSLARALVSGRPLLLLDEPTSQVDLDSESRLLESIATLGRDRTVIMITHRTTSLAGMDRTIEVTSPAPLAPSAVESSEHTTGKEHPDA